MSNPSSTKQSVESGLLGTIFHIFDPWTGMCGCGAGPFTTAEHRHHYLAVYPPVQQGGPSDA